MIRSLLAVLLFVSTAFADPPFIGPPAPRTPGAPRGIDVRSAGAKVADCNRMDFNLGLAAAGCTVGGTCNCTFTFDPITKVDLYEEFITQGIGDRDYDTDGGWSCTGAGGAGSGCTGIDGSNYNHPGLVFMDTPATLNAAKIIHTLGLRDQNTRVVPNPFFGLTGQAGNWFMEWMFAPRQNTTTVRIMAGMYGNMPDTADTPYNTLAPADFIGVLFDTSLGSTVRCYACASSTCSGTASSYVPSTGTYMKVRIDMQNTSTLRCNIDGEVVTHTTNLPASSVVFNSYLAVQPLSASIRGLSVDYAWYSANVSR